MAVADLCVLLDFFIGIGRFLRPTIVSRGSMMSLPPIAVCRSRRTPLIPILIPLDYAGAWTASYSEEDLGGAPGIRNTEVQQVVLDRLLLLSFQRDVNEVFQLYLERVV